MAFHRLVLSVALAGGMALVVPFAAASEPPRAAASIAVESVDVEQVAELGVGVPLRFTVFGTPGSLVGLRIDGARRLLELRETEPGVYEGSYVIDDRDAIAPDSRVLATLQRNGVAAYSTLDEPLLLARGVAPWGAPADAQAAKATEPGRPVPMRGADAPPSSMATATQIPIAVAPIPWQAQSQSVPSQSTPSESVPPRSFRSQPVPFDAVPPHREQATCGDCAVVESIRAVEAAPRGGVVGAVGGAIAGALLGKEVGAAHTRRVMAVLGAIGGAFAGRAIERQATRSAHYDVELRLSDGTVLKRRYESVPPFTMGETIRLGTSAGRGTPVPASF